MAQNLLSSTPDSINKGRLINNLCMINFNIFVEENPDMIISDFDMHDQKLQVIKNLLLQLEDSIFFLEGMLKLLLMIIIPKKLDWSDHTLKSLKLLLIKKYY